MDIRYSWWYIRTENSECPIIIERIGITSSSTAAKNYRFVAEYTVREFIDYFGFKLGEEKTTPSDEETKQAVAIYKIIVEEFPEQLV